jgi:hypothetical protein
MIGNIYKRSHHLVSNETVYVEVKAQTEDEVYFIYLRDIKDYKKNLSYL